MSYRTLGLTPTFTSGGTTFTTVSTDLATTIARRAIAIYPTDPGKAVGQAMADAAFVINERGTMADRAISSSLSSGVATMKTQKTQAGIVTSFGSRYTQPTLQEVQTQLEWRIGLLPKSTPTLVTPVYRPGTLTFAPPPVKPVAPTLSPPLVFAPLAPRPVAPVAAPPSAPNIFLPPPAPSAPPPVLPPPALPPPTPYMPSDADVADAAAAAAAAAERQRQEEERRTAAEVEAQRQQRAAFEEAARQIAEAEAAQAQAEATLRAAEERLRQATNEEARREAEIEVAAAQQRVSDVYYSTANVTVTPPQRDSATPPPGFDPRTIPQAPWRPGYDPRLPLEPGQTLTETVQEGPPKILGVPWYYVAGGAAVVVVSGALLLGGKKKPTPNRRRKRRR